MQSLWEKGLDWETQHNELEISKWSEIVDTLLLKKIFEIPRYLPSSEENELLSFTDGSKSTYCAVVYIRSKLKNLWIVNLLLSKIRLAPVRKISIPRLELLAVIIGIRCLNFIASKIAIPIKKKRLWTD